MHIADGIGTGLGHVLHAQCHINARQQVLLALGLVEQHQHPVSLALDVLQTARDIPVAALPGHIRPQQIAQRRRHVHPDRGRGGGFHHAMAQREMHPSVIGIAELMQLEYSVGRLYFAPPHAVHRGLVQQPELDQIRNGADAQIMARGKVTQPCASSQVAVLVEHVGEHRGGCEPGEARDIAASLGMTGTLQHPTGFRTQRKHVSGLHDVTGMRAASDRGAHRVGAISCRNTGADALGRFDRYREAAAMAAHGFTDHQRQTQLLATLRGQAETDQAARLAGHEIDFLGADVFGRRQKRAPELFVIVIDQHHHGAMAEAVDQLLRGIEGHDEGNPCCARNSRLSTVPCDCAARSPSSSRSR